MSANQSAAAAASAQRWRPLGEADRDWARAEAEAALQRWQDEWLDQRLLGVTAVETLAPGHALDDGAGARWQAGDRLAAQTDAGAWKRYALAAMALSAQADAQVPEALLAPFKHELMESLLARLGGDFLRGVDAPTLQRALPGSGFALPRGGLRLRIGSARDPHLLDLYCAAELAWARPMKGAPAVPRIDKPAPLSAALGDSELRLSAVIGSCELSALQLSELAVGDVLTTSQLLHEAIQVRLHADDAPPRTVALGRPGRSQQRLSIVLTSITQK
ncbi:FliM/FliN family flagellar motor C-terminal domain-containing protein [Lysobacter gummosus]|uniref:FliM/FliN family flagellar motor switch protein n=1 Tax=Lysobacter gummosus TaxID=262324 RepID=A0ABY3X8S5_9GAMM|nr:FliM/FliN family flagellar motor switch protein [Lysobacter gummosus]ALN93533.1 surface presentation of antigens family protein [Lysobacter gummosus]UNP28981.1 FliM/FliN family flagellar motor switch protein [Lysobacter gummosus]